MDAHRRQTRTQEIADSLMGRIWNPDWGQFTGPVEVHEHGKIANTPTALKGLVSRLTRSGATLQFCYEAGPCGYRIQRQLTAAGHGCAVVAPSLIPRKRDRIKTDRRDATNLAKLHPAWPKRAGPVPRLDDRSAPDLRGPIRARGSECAPVRGR